MSEVTRSGILERLDSPEVRVVCLWAPAGFGKSTVARQFAYRTGRAQLIDLSGVASCGEIARRFTRDSSAGQAGAALGATELEPPQWLAYARRFWRVQLPGVVLLENAEGVTDAEGGEAFLADLLAVTPRPLQLVICSRRPLDVRVGRFAMPHEVYVFNERHLAFDLEETQRALETTPEAAAKIQAVTRGWPLCVRMVLRLIRESSLDDLLRRIGSLQVDALYDYLFENILDCLDHPARTALVALAAIPSPTHADLEKLFGTAATDLERRALAGAFTTLRDGIYELHPLVRDTVRHRWATEVHEMLVTAAQRWRADDPIRAALCYTEAQEPALAAECVATMSLSFVAAPQVFDFNTILYGLPRVVVLEHPQLWSGSMVFQGLAIAPEQRLQEALHVWNRLAAGVDEAVRLSVLSEVINALSNLGRHAEAQAYYDRYLVAASAAGESARMYRGVWGAGLSGRQGRYDTAKRYADDVLEQLKAVPGSYAIVGSEVYVRRLRAIGDWPQERLAQDIALQYARDSKNAVPLALSLIEAIFGAWFAGDGTRFDTLLQEFDDFRVPSIAAGTALFRRCAFGRLDSLNDGKERPQIRAYAYLIAAGTAPREERRWFAKRAVIAADAANETILQCYARVALALLDSRARRQHLLEASEFACRLEVPQPAAAVADLLEGRMPPYFKALSSRLVDGGKDPALFHLSIADQTLRQGSRSISLTKREMELVCYLGLRGGYSSIDEIAEAMAPEKDSQSANQLLRVLAARVRQKCGKQIIVRSATRGYALGSDVAEATQSIAERLEASQLPARLPAAEVSALRGDLAEVRRQMAIPLPPWEWAAELETRLASLDLALTARLQTQTPARRSEADGDEIAG